MLQINDELQASNFQRLLILLVLSLFGLMVGFLAIGVFYKIGLLLVCSLSLLFAQWKRLHLLAMGTWQNRQSEMDWQLQLVQGYIAVPYGATTDIWQAKLDKIVDMRCVMVLTFNVFEPLPMPLTVYIWQDQVSDDTWRQLKILAR